MTIDEIGPGELSIVLVMLDHQTNLFFSELNLHNSYLGPGNWFYIGEEDTANYGLVNLAAFLAYGVTQSIQYDSW